MQSEKCSSSGKIGRNVFAVKPLFFPIKINCFLPLKKFSFHTLRVTFFPFFIHFMASPKFISLSPFNHIITSLRLYLLFYKCIWNIIYKICLSIWIKFCVCTINLISLIIKIKFIVSLKSKIVVYHNACQ